MPHHTTLAYTAVYQLTNSRHARPRTYYPSWLPVQWVVSFLSYIDQVKRYVSKVNSGAGQLFHLCCCLSGSDLNHPLFSCMTAVRLQRCFCHYKHRRVFNVCVRISAQATWLSEWVGSSGYCYSNCCNKNATVICSRATPQIFST